MGDDVQKQAAAEGTAGFIENMIKLMIAIRTRSEADIAEIENQIRPIMGDSEPVEIAGPLAFFRMSQVLYREGTPTMGELSEKLMIPHATGTRLVSWWVNNGLAERLSDPKDRRIVRVELTQKGRQFHEILEGHAIRRVQRILGRLTADEQIVFSLLLAKLVSS